MTLSRTEVVVGLVDELEAFGALIAPLDEKAWAAPTRCDGWSVADVAAHVIGSMADVAGGRLEGLGTPEVTAREVAERQGRSPAELAAELASVTKLTVELAGAFDDAAWAGPGPGRLRRVARRGRRSPVVRHVPPRRRHPGRPRSAERGRTRHPRERGACGHDARQEQVGAVNAALRRVGARDGRAWAGRVLTGDPMRFVLAATGRGDPAPLGLESSVNIYA